MSRQNGDLPLSSYGVIGDGRTVAFVGLDGSIDWLPLPALDAPPLLAGLLDPERGGAFELAPEEDWQVERRYLEGANVLETVFRTAHGAARVVDALNVGAAGRLPWTELARRIEGLEGRVALRFCLRPGDRFATARPWATARGPAAIVRLADQTVALVADHCDEWQVADREVSGRLVVRAGERRVLALVGTDGEPLYVPSPAAIDARVDGTVEAWRRFTNRLDYEGPQRAAVQRSALALKLLIHAPSGAIAAAPTTSLPEVVGGERNYDYRFAWVRDTSFVIDALGNLGCFEEFHASLSWLLATVRRTAPDVHVLYTIAGEVTEGEQEVPYRGWRATRPVRVGNTAASQRQLGTYGDLLESVCRYVAFGNVLDESTAALVASCANRVCDLWQEPDAGLWELHERRHYTSSKLGCWAALDRACRLAEAGQVASLDVTRWSAERDRIATYLRTRCWSEAKGAYGFAADSDELDAAVLLAGRIGFDRGERLSSTIDAIAKELGRGPLLYRYSGMQEAEHAFLACSFWMVEALCYVGRLEEAIAQMDELVGLTGELGLLSEEMDVTTHELLGNFPLGLTHLALVNAATTIAASSAERATSPQRFARAS